MKSINIKARIKRNKLDIVAGKNYRNEESEIVKYLRKTNKDAILGIENEMDYIPFLVRKKYIIEIKMVSRETFLLRQY
ncbi:hypothetical protein EGY07_19010 [Chryseobacterium indologenes]|uniref:hypothetical protein n=1 Tax=Chryseobacterium indologenes TaxID=253 RepID=UPI000F4F75CA|nr:hypothetical protein [Chryseobacterium indologenes]AYZ37477.1 hypothetical protein EGY07_19010 [Chryseobacterium indologenes]